MSDWIKQFFMVSPLMIHGFYFCRNIWGDNSSWSHFNTALLQNFFRQTLVSLAGLWIVVQRRSDWIQTLSWVSSLECFCIVRHVACIRFPQILQFPHWKHACWLTTTCPQVWVKMWMVILFASLCPCMDSPDQDVTCFSPMWLQENEWRNIKMFYSV